MKLYTINNYNWVVYLFIWMYFYCENIKLYCNSWQFIGVRHADSVTLIFIVLNRILSNIKNQYIFI